MNICIETGDWGECRIEDIRKLLEDVANQFTQHFSGLPNQAIRVQCRPNEVAPRILYRVSQTDDYVVWLTTRDRFWSQYAYQFAHELCHLASDFERLRLTANQWFHETLCELASLFTLKQMAATWPSFPPYKNWASYAPSLESYADEIINRQEHRLPANVSLSDWFHVNEPILRADQHQRTLNTLVAVQLLPLVQASPALWQSVRHMPNTDEPFPTFLSAWCASCPDSLRSFPALVAQKFHLGAVA